MSGSLLVVPFVLHVATRGRLGPWYHSPLSLLQVIRETMLCKREVTWFIIAIFWLLETAFQASQAIAQDDLELLNSLGSSS